MKGLVIVAFLVIAVAAVVTAMPHIGMIKYTHASMYNLLNTWLLDEKQDNRLQNVRIQELLSAIQAAQTIDMPVHDGESHHCMHAILYRKMVAIR